MLRDKLREGKPSSSLARLQSALPSSARMHHLRQTKRNNNNQQSSDDKPLAYVVNQLWAGELFGETGA